MLKKKQNKGDFMDYGNCSRQECGKFAQLNRYTRLCSNCHEKYFQIIKDYLNENGNMDIKTLSREIHVSTKVIEGYVAEGRLQEVLRKNNININSCPHCGAIVSEIGLCDKCKQDLKNLRDIQQQLNNKSTVPDFDLPKTESHGMRYFNK